MARKLYSLFRAGMKCKDCGRNAVEMDHRDYNRQRDVDPVCHSCNQLRGPGIPIRPNGSRRDWYLSWELHPKPLYRFHYANGKSIEEISSWYGVSKAAIRRIIREAKRNGAKP